jgi:hypothetical protein
MNAHRLAAIAVLALGGYLQLVEWVDLYPWNNVRHGNHQEMLDLAIGAATLALAALMWIGWRPAAWLSAAGLGVWAWLQLTTWWIPYFAGASPGWARTYARVFAETTAWLPRSEGHLPPDANHLVLHLLIVIALAASVRAAIAK